MTRLLQIQSSHIKFVDEAPGLPGENPIFQVPLKGESLKTELLSDGAS
jgi:hypothetical protein